MIPNKKLGGKKVKPGSPVQPRAKEKKPPPGKGTSRDPLNIVGIVGSAEALEAFEQFFPDLPTKSGLELDLLESRERFQTLEDTIPDITFETDGAGNKTFISKQWTTYTGMTPEETANRGWVKAFYPEEAKAEEARWKEVLQTGEFAEGRHRLRAADGSYRWFLVRARPTRNGERMIVRWTGSLTDVDDLVRAQEALRIRENELRLFMDAVPALIAYVDTKGCYRQVNKNYARWFGRSPEETWGRPMRDLLGEAQWEKIKGYVDKALAGETVAYERQLPFQGGEPRWIQAIYSPEFDELNRVQGFVVHVMDIEERKKTEKELYDSRNDLNRAQAVAHTGSWRLDTQRNELLWSDENYRIFGIPRRTALSYEAFLGAVHPDDRSYVDRKWMAALGGKPYDIEHRILVDGRIKWVRERAELEFDSDGILLGGFGTSQDITERKEAEEAIKASRDELEMRVQKRTAELKKANEHLAEQSRILESFFKDTITPLVLLDRDFNFIRVNEAYARACQRAVADFPGHNHFEFYPHEEYEAIFRRVVETGIPYQATAKPFSFPDHPEWGVTFWDWILTPLPDDRGETAFLVFSLEEVTDRQTSEEALRNSERQLRILADQLLYAQENERKRIARDMHDSLGATLSAVKYKLEDLVHNLPEKDPRQIGETLRSLVPIFQETIGEARRMQNDLRPPLLDDLGILPTLTWLSREFQKIYSRITIEPRLDVREEDVPDLLKVVIFRITQEALNNIGKHARATQARIYLGGEQGRLKLVIGDNGAGFDYKRLPESANQSTGMGLSSMKERAELSGGSFSLETQPGQGTAIEVSWPLNK